MSLSIRMFGAARGLLRRIRIPERTRAVLVTLLFGLVACAGADAFAEKVAPYATLPHPLEFQRVPGANIFYTIGSAGIPTRENAGNTSNAGFVITDEGVVVFDALGTPSLGWALLHIIRTTTEKPVRYVVVSHYHADHIYGLQAFKDHTRAIILAQERAAEYQENRGGAEERATARLTQRREALFPWVDDKTRVVPPDRTFRNRAAFALGGRTFTLIYAGPAHSASDSMMMVEPDRVLFAGDIVQSGRIPFLNSDDVDTGRWLRALAEVEALQPRFIVPGHGAASTEATEAIRFTRDYIQYVRAAMAKAVDSWIEFDVAYDQTDWSRYKGIAAFASNNRGNAYRIFLELEQEKFEPAR